MIELLTNNKKNWGIWTYQKLLQIFIHPTFTIHMHTLSWGIYGVIVTSWEFFYYFYIIQCNTFHSTWYCYQNIKFKKKKGKKR